MGTRTRQCGKPVRSSSTGIEKSLRVRLCPPPSPIPFPIVDDLLERGMTDYVVFPLESGSNVSVVVSIATLRPNGFPDDFISAFERLIPILSLSVAYKVERFQFRQVPCLHRTGTAARVLNGQIRQGDVVTASSDRICRPSGLQQRQLVSMPMSYWRCSVPFSTGRACCSRV